MKISGKYLKVLLKLYNAKKSGMDDQEAWGGYPNKNSQSLAQSLGLRHFQI